MFFRNFIYIVFISFVVLAVGCKNPVAPEEPPDEPVNQAPVASFYDFDYLVEGAGSTGVNGEYVYLGSFNGYPSYTSGTFYLFNFFSSGLKWGLDSVRDHVLSNKYYYINSFDGRPPEADSGIWNIGVGLSPSPSVTAVSPISGYTDEPGYEVRGNYIFSDGDGDTEAQSTYKWYLCDNETDPGSVISGESGITYTTQNSDEGKYLRFEVTPLDSAGSVGIPILSNAVLIGI